MPANVMLLLASEAADFGLVPAKTARQRAQELADEHQAAVTVRDAVTDQVLGTLKPKQQR